MDMNTQNCTIVAFTSGVAGIAGWAWQNLFVLNFSATVAGVCTAVSGAMLVYQKVQQTRREERMQEQSSDIDQVAALIRQQNSFIAEIGRRNAIIVNLQRKLSGTSDQEETLAELKRLTADGHQYGESSDNDLHV
jgi:hypothetical protein